MRLMSRFSTQIDIREFSSELRSFLNEPRNFPDDTLRVEEIETHFAFVFLTDTLAYKVKKPILWREMDFRTLEARRFHCNEEIRLNRELAPDLYLNLASVGRNRDGCLSWAERERILEYVVVMRRLPRARMLESALTDCTLPPDCVASLVQIVDGFHRQTRSQDISADDYIRHLEQYLATHLELNEVISRDVL